MSTVHLHRRLSNFSNTRNDETALGFLGIGTSSYDTSELFRDRSCYCFHLRSSYGRHVGTIGVEVSKVEGCWDLHHLFKHTFTKRNELLAIILTSLYVTELYGQSSLNTFHEEESRRKIPATSRSVQWSMDSIAPTCHVRNWHKVQEKKNTRKVSKWRHSWNGLH
jgi:hypothetical protein